MTKPRALLSVYDKRNLETLAKTLSDNGYELVSSGGTAKALEACGLKLTPVESITGNPEAFDGRMKTLSFQIESAILFDRDNPVHQKEASALKISPIDIVVCNFYPFQKAVEEKQPLQQAIELIDIGGPAMVRAAAKNFRHVTVLVDPSDYAEVEKALKEKKSLPYSLRESLAAKAFRMTADYDSQIDTYFSQFQNEKVLRLRFSGGEALRYGENPHQEGTVYWCKSPDPMALHKLTQRSGKELSFNNWLDVDAALRVLARLGGTEAAGVIIKHANPCGTALGNTIESAFEKAWEGDPVASFGGIVALNRPITHALVEKILTEKKFIEVLIAPAIEDKPLEILSEQKKNWIVLTNAALLNPDFSPVPEYDIKKIRGGVLIQQPDTAVITEKDLEITSKRKPTESEIRDLLFLWKIVQETKSNTIAIAKNNQLLGSGAGQQDRVRACKLALEKAGEKAKGAVAASDGFFPFPDGPEILINAGITAILHPGGSMRDSETIQLCDKHGVALATTKGVRAFKH